MTTNEITRVLHELKLREWPVAGTPWRKRTIDKHPWGNAANDAVWEDTCQNNRIQRLIKTANFRLKASIEELETDTTRGIAASSVSDLVTGNYITNGMTMIIQVWQGQARHTCLCPGRGEACRKGVKVLYFTMNMLIENLKLVHPKDERLISSARSTHMICSSSMILAW